MTNFGTLLSYEQPTKYIVNDTNYKPTYKTPVLTAGKSFILGYTNETDNIFDDLPVIIFDDFTTESKFVDFPFKVKSSAMKILHINQDLVLPKYAFYLMQATEIDHDNHQRYWISTYSQEIISLPPLSEQIKIIETVENLFDLTQSVETNSQNLKNSIKTTKSKILDLAIRGKLVPQDPNDEPASVLLERIRAEKEELIKQGKIKRDKKESVIFKGDDNSYYQDLPNCWSVCKLCEISYFERGITFPASAKEIVPTDRNIACARTANVQDLFDISNLIYVDRSFMKDNPDKLLKVNDIIVSTANSLELVGKSCIVEKLLEKMTFGGFVTVVRGIGINHKYIHMCLKNKFLKGEFSYKSTQTTNIANISTKDLAETIIYLPPLAEQERIVNAVETLFAQIDKIAEQIS